MRGALVLAAIAVVAASAVPANRSIDAYFAPFDTYQDLTQEVDLAKNVIKARQACPIPYFEPASNPFSIKYSVYNLMLTPAIEAMVAAHKANVFVQVLIQYTQLFPNMTWNTMAQNFTAANMSVVRDDNDCLPYGALDCSTVNMIGTRARGSQFMGLMHTKMRLFHHTDSDCWRGGSCYNHTSVVTGSLNPDNAALKNDETLLVMHDDPVFYADYDAIYRSIHTQTTHLHRNVWDPAKDINVFFSKGVGATVSERLFAYLEAEQELAFLFVYSLRDVIENGFGPQQNRSMAGNHLIDQLRAAQARGVSIVVMTDIGEVMGTPGFSPPDASNTSQRIAALGIPVYMCNNTAGPFNAFHHKNGLFGLTQMQILTDTANWSEAAMGSEWWNKTIGNFTRMAPPNDETTMLMDSYRRDNNLTGLRFLSQVLRLLRTYENQNVPRGQPSADEIFAKVVAQRGAVWPRVAFSAAVSLTSPPSNTSYAAEFVAIVLTVSPVVGQPTTLHLDPVLPAVKKAWAVNATRFHLAKPLSYPWGQRLHGVTVGALLHNGSIVPLSAPTAFSVDPANRTLETAGQASISARSVTFVAENLAP